MLGPPALLGLIGLEDAADLAAREQPSNVARPASQPLSGWGFVARF